MCAQRPTDIPDAAKATPDPGHPSGSRRDRDGNTSATGNVVKKIRNVQKDEKRRMNMMKKIGALVVALVMVLAMSSSAFAATDVYSGSEQTDALVTGTNIPLTKGIVLFNTDGSEIREPNISFTYTVTPIDETVANQGEPLVGTTVTDDGSRNSGTPVTVNVYDGVAGAFTSSLTLTFADTNAKVAAEQSGTEVEKTGNLVVTLSAFQHAGIYRYKITEVANPGTITNVGLDARTSDYDSTRYLDVYIKNNDTGTGLEMYGAVIFKTTETTSGSEGTEDINTSTKKTTGFEPGVDPSDASYTYENDNTFDKYHTFNLEVNKTITGGLADKTHDFPFEITLTGDKTETIIADYSKIGATYHDGTEPTTVNINTTAAVLTPALSNGDSVTITGIPVGTTVLVKETNDTYDQYTPSITTQTGFTGLTLTENGALTALTGTTQLSAAAQITSKTSKSVIGLTNTLAEVSPTGVVLRIAPYALILAGGIALLLISRRRKASVEEE